MNSITEYLKLSPTNKVAPEPVKVDEEAKDVQYEEPTLKLEEKQYNPTISALEMAVPVSIKCPFVDGGKLFIGGEIFEYSGKVDAVTSPILNDANEKYPIGKLSQMEPEDALLAVEHAQKAWKHGQGVWPQMSMEQRISAVEDLVARLQQKRSEIIDILTWEICKSVKDAATEFDRTMIFIDATIKQLRSMVAQSSWETVSGVVGRYKRCAIGTMLCLGPFNYPFNETYATMIPALLMV